MIKGTRNINELNRVKQTVCLNSITFKHCETENKNKNDPLILNDNTVTTLVIVTV